MWGKPLPFFLMPNKAENHSAKTTWGRCSPTLPNAGAPLLSQQGCCCCCCCWAALIAGHAERGFPEAPRPGEGRGSWASPAEPFPCQDPYHAGTAWSLASSTSLSSFPSRASRFPSCLSSWISSCGRKENSWSGHSRGTSAGSHSGAGKGFPPFVSPPQLKPPAPSFIC